MIRIGLAFAFSFAVLATPAYSCSVERIASSSELISRAEIIVRARAEGLAATKARVGILGILSGGTTQVRLRVLEVLKGTFPTTTIEVAGSVSEQDDPNDRPAPYDLVRAGGRRGNCFAVEYRQGAEYLLMLARASHPAYAAPDDLTPYWAPLAATNEQVFGADDPWLVWVRSALF